MWNLIVKKRRLSSNGYPTVVLRFESVKLDLVVANVCCTAVKRGDCLSALLSVWLGFDDLQ
jgi:hypothetical protein